MKKLFLSLAVVFSVAMISCGGAKTEDNANAEGANNEATEAPAPEAAAAGAVEATETVENGDTAVNLQGEAVAVETPAAE